jgi:hypothetical protein
MKNMEKPVCDYIVDKDDPNLIMVKITVVP